MKFSPNGKQILMCTNGEHMKLVDSFSGNITYELKGHQNNKVRLFNDILLFMRYD